MAAATIGAIIGEALLSAAVEVLVEKISSGEFVDFFRSKKLDVSLLKKVKTKLLGLQAILNDAEEKQITNPAVKEWLDELTYAVFDADDLLDEINTEALRCKVEAESQSQTVKAKVRNVFSSPFKRSSGVFNSEMQKLFERLEHFARQKDILQLKEGVSSGVWHGKPTGSVVDESAIYGRDEDKKKLKDYLLSEDASGSKIGVIAIVGMGGIGKTTLAKLLYNDPEVKKKFNLRAWVHIPKDFDGYRVTKALHESVTSKTTETKNLNSLQVELQQSLSRKRFLLVLDDIWGGSYEDWNNLKAIFNSGEMGSKIIITTRDESVALAMKTFLPIYHLASLAGEDCWSLLAKHAFGENNCSERSNLELIGKEIAKKCDGLPLAAVALGGLLRTKLSKNHWNKVLKSNIWDLPNVEVTPALLLSYHYLPAPLKRCFAYCSIFPKNSKLEKVMVVRLWIAEGLVHQSKSEKTVEEIGDEYFDELVSRSLIRRQSMNGEADFEMHDLINDLATMVSSAYCIRCEDRKPLESLDKVRHLSYNKGRYDYFNEFDTFYGSKCLRTFLALPLREWCMFPRPYPVSKVVDDLLPAMRQLRVLSLSGYGTLTKLPNSVLENLIHLRYLDLSYTKIERLPCATCRLYNLQTLLLSNCECLIELPKDMGKLVNLRHLDISGTELKEMPLQIASLQNLQTLSDFVVSKNHGGLKVAMLRKFPHLQGKLSILKLQNVIDPSDAFQANLRQKEQIEELSLEWDDCTAEDSQLDVLECLQPSTNLKKLTIQFYGGSSFPKWLGDSSFGNMVYLYIHGFRHCRSLPPLGQLRSLKELEISDLKSVKTVGTEFYGSSSTSFQPFPSLEILQLCGMLEWEEWSLIGGTATEFPSLEELRLSCCPKLKGSLPSNLPSLSKLELGSCPKLKGNLPSNYPSLTELELYYSPESGHSDDNSNITRPLDVFRDLMLPLNSLRSLTITGIPSLTSFPRDGLPKTLVSLTLWNCENLEFLPHDGLPKTLVSLTLRNCENLEFLPHESLRSYTSLEYLAICSSCDSLTSFSLGCLPVLQTLLIDICKNLKSISIAEDASHSTSLSYLQTLSVFNCSNLESFPQGGMPAPNLVSFVVSNCKKLNSLPEPIHTLAGLQELSVTWLPNLQSFAQEGGLPINLRSLDVGWGWGGGGNFLNPGVSEWGLRRLTCLSKLQIGTEEVVNALMTMNVPLLPTSLVSLAISGLDNTTYLDGKWLQHLTSLEDLKISGCRSLKSLPQEGLPSSLSELTIWNCPLLKAASSRRKLREEWPQIARIPCIIIDDEVII